MIFKESLKFSLQVTAFLAAFTAVLTAWGFIAHWFIVSFSLWVSLPSLVGFTVLITATIGWLVDRNS